MIHIEQLNYAYGHKHVLKNIQLEFPAHQFSVILGRNGCGKSTLFKLMSGLEQTTDGQVLYAGRALENIKGKERAALLGFLPQFHKTVFPFLVKDVVITGRAAFSRFRPSKQDWDMVDQALIDLDIEHLKERPYTELSGGERQLVMIARILVQAPKVILLDEPTNHLDVYYQSYLMKKLRQLSRQNFTVIAIMHDPNLAFLFADHLFFMREHEVIRPDSKARLTDPKFLKSVYDVEFHEAMIQDKTIVIPDHSWL
ncbi:ABC transporter ATP-binding protein [Acinetobacter sp. YH12239]|uniref:ABC transporter ATP-binding protein n=1 Tax=Acinetobacter sp. YH12239 TaxID=2601166 RepID=UPI0015D43CD6|nr:ABC transporter ATP-binding protein [Acinetobacter sp. YH12239]